MITQILPGCLYFRGMSQRIFIRIYRNGYKDVVLAPFFRSIRPKLFSFAGPRAQERPPPSPNRGRAAICLRQGPQRAGENSL